MTATDWIVWGSLTLIFLLSFSRASIVCFIEVSITYGLVGYLESSPELWSVLGVDYMLIMSIKDALFLGIFLVYIQRYALVKIAYSINMLGNLAIYSSYHLGSESLYDFCYDNFERMQLIVNALFIIGLIINDRNRIIGRVSDAYSSFHSNILLFIGHLSTSARSLSRIKKP